MDCYFDIVFIFTARVQRAKKKQTTSAFSASPIPPAFAGGMGGELSD
jgi:hypothetical protein